MSTEGLEVSLRERAMLPVGPDRRQLRAVRGSKVPRFRVSRACCPNAPGRSRTFPVHKRDLSGSTPRGERCARNGAFRVRSPWRSLRTLRGAGSARLTEMAASSGGEKISACTRNLGGSISRRSARNGAFRVRSPWRSLRTLRGIGSARLAETAASSGGRKDCANTPETRNQEPETPTRGPVARSVSAPFRFGIPAYMRSLVGSISRNAAADATGPSGFGARGGRCGRCVGSVLQVLTAGRPESG